MIKLMLEYKKLSSAFLIFFLFNFFILRAISETKAQYEYLTFKKNRILQLEKKENIIKKNIEKLKLEEEKLKSIQSKNNSELFSYNTLGSLEKEINTLIESNDINLLEVDRIIGGKNNNFLLPFLVSGKEKNIFSFIFELDKIKKISIIDNLIELKKEKDLIYFRFIVKANIKNKKEVLQNGKRKTNLMSSENNDLKLVKFKIINENQGIFYIKDKYFIKKYYLNNKQKIKINENIYELLLDDKILIITNLKNKNKTILYLEACYEENYAKN